MNLNDLKIEDLFKADGDAPVNDPPVTKKEESEKSPQEEGSPDPIDENAPEPEPDPEPVGGDDEPIFFSVSKLLGYEVEGEFDETIEGFAEYTKKMSEVIAEDKVSKLFEKFPAALDLIQHLHAGGKAEEWTGGTSRSSFEEFDVDKASEEKLKATIRESLKLQDFTDEEIEESLEDFEETNLLKTQGRRAQSYLKKHYEKVRASREKELERERLENQRKTEEAITSIKTTIKAGELGGKFVIPEKEKQSFEDWLLVPDKSGKTKRDVEREKMTMQEKLALEYLYFKKFNLKDVVQKEAASLKANALRERLKTTKSEKVIDKRSPGSSPGLVIPSLAELT